MLKVSAPKPVLLLNIGQLLTLEPQSNSKGPRRGAELKQLEIIQDGAVLCIGGKVVSVGKTRSALRDVWVRKHKRNILEIDCQRGVVVPGFVDSHTHPAFVSPRLTDFERRIAGASYEEIARSGGGIRSSVEGVRRAGKRELAEKVLGVFRQAAQHGTTTIEAKSGYGLSLEAELKSLEAIRFASEMWAGTAVPTLLGAHAVPREFQAHREDYVTLVCEEMIPQAAQKKLARFVDVFCDRAGFSEDESIRVLSAARKWGLGVRAHVSQLVRSPLEKLLALDPISLDHLDQVSDHDLGLLAKSSTVATLVPAANYFLGLQEFPPARKMVDAGVAVALATDCNPGSAPTTSMPLVMSLACTHMEMNPAEAIAAATINGAWALGVARTKGSIAPGKDADLALFNVADYREIPYWVGSNFSHRVIAQGAEV